MSQSPIFSICLYNNFKKQLLAPLEQNCICSKVDPAEQIMKSDLVWSDSIQSSIGAWHRWKDAPEEQNIGW